jgi:hypothetical protein
VTPLNSRPRHCRIDHWGADGAHVSADILCDKRTATADPAHDNAQPADTSFAVTMVGETFLRPAAVARVAYAWGNDPSGDLVLDPAYNWVSSGGQVSQHRVDVGSYTVTIPGVGNDDGDVLVSAYADPRHCEVLGWGPSGADLLVSVGCRDFTGVPADSRYDIQYLRHAGLEGFGGGPAASLWANDPTAASYHPSAYYAWSSNGRRATIARLSRGVYRVTLRGMPAGGAAIVSTYRTDGNRSCQLGSIRTSGRPQQVVVRCFTLGGVPADSRFVLSYTR